MNKPRSKSFRLARAAGWTLLALAALYLIAGNVLLKTRLLRFATNTNPDELLLEYQSAYTLFPGHVNVKGLTLRFEDRSIRFGLALDEATVQIALFELLRMKFHATRVRTTGVSWRMLHKVSAIEGQEKRVAAFPDIDGFDDPPVQLPPSPGPPSTGEGTWSVQLDDVEADVRELWMLEYRYVGAGHASGSFELKPMRSVWVGPCTLDLAEGALLVGKQIVSKNFAMHAEVTLTPVDIPSSPGLLMLRPITAAVQLAALISDVGAAELYSPGLGASGTATLAADLKVVKGRLAAGSTLEASSSDLKLRSSGLGFEGTVNAAFKLAPDAEGLDVPIGHAAAEGALRVPISNETTVTAALTGAVADFSIVSADLVEGLALNWLHAKLGEARVADARAITTAAGKKAPVIAPAVLGNGPLVAGGTADVTSAKTLVWLTHAKLGDAALSGVAVKTGKSWSGAAAGRVAVVPIGVRLTNDSLEVLPFIKEGWLDEQYVRLGIQPERPVR